MKKKWSTIFLVMLSIYGIICLGQEFVKQKTKYVSVQQDIELDGELVMVGTSLQSLLIDFSKTIIVIIQQSLEKVNHYATGQKNDSTKQERTQKYTIKAKLKKELEQCLAEISHLLQKITSLVTELNKLDEKIQSE